MPAASRHSALSAGVCFLADDDRRAEPTPTPARPTAARRKKTMTAAERRFLWKARLVCLPAVVSTGLSAPVFMDAIAADPQSAARYVQSAAALLILVSKISQLVHSFAAPRSFLRRKDLYMLFDINVSIPVALGIQYSHPWPPDQAHHPLFEFLFIMLFLSMYEVPPRPAILTILLQVRRMRGFSPLGMACTRAGCLARRHPSICILQRPEHRVNDLPITY